MRSAVPKLSRGFYARFALGAMLAERSDSDGALVSVPRVQGVSHATEDNGRPVHRIAARFRGCAGEPTDAPADGSARSGARHCRAQRGQGESGQVTRGDGGAAETRTESPALAHGGPGGRGCGAARAGHARAQRLDPQARARPGGSVAPRPRLTWTSPQSSPVAVGARPLWQPAGIRAPATLHFRAVSHGIPP